MVASIGKFTLKKLTLLPKFLKLSKLVYTQALTSNGNIVANINNEGVKIFYSFTIWDSTESMLDFVHTNHHQTALQKTAKLCKEACFTHFKVDEIIDFATAKAALQNSADVRFIEYN